MSYSDQKFYARPFVPVANNVTSTATATASGHVVTNTNVEASQLPLFNRRTLVGEVKANVRTAPTTTTTKLAFLNGTATFAVATIGTSAAGATVSVTPTADNTFAAAVEPTITVIGTATASANQSMGNYDLWFELQEQYS